MDIFFWCLLSSWMFLYPKAQFPQCRSLANPDGTYIRLYAVGQWNESVCSYSSLSPPTSGTIFSLCLYICICIFAFSFPSLQYAVPSSSLTLPPRENFLFFMQGKWNSKRQFQISLNGAYTQKMEHQTQNGEFCIKKKKKNFMATRENAAQWWICDTLWRRTRVSNCCLWRLVRWH